MADNEDRLSFLNSPWVQLGVPLAAMAATAIAPRHTGQAARIGMYGFNNLNDYHSQQMRLSQLKAQADAEALEKQRKQENYIKAVRALQVPDAVASGAHAPEGGTTPEADSSVRTGMLDAGVVPTPHTKWDPEQLALLQMLPEDLGYPIMAKDVERQREASTGYQMGDLARLQQLTPPGVSLSGVDVAGVGNASIQRVQPRMVTSHEGGRETNVAIDPYSNTRLSTLDIGEHKDPETEKEFHVVTTRNGKPAVVFYTRDGVQKVITNIGDEKTDKSTLLQNFGTKMWMRANGKVGFDPEFEAKVTVDEAKKFIAEKQDFLTQLFSGGFGGGVPNVTPGGE